MSEREDYTPDTETVRAAYMEVGGHGWPERGEEFDRWIIAHDKALRERIAREIEVMLIGSDAGRGSEVIAAHDSALSRAARIARGEESTDEH